MPLFDFHCRVCDKTSELLIRSDAVASCPYCGSAEMEKQLSVIAPANKSNAIINGARRQANKEGHFSNYSSSERRGLPKG
ncbi:MAG TPA: zinc ribbon domain-containing protein [Rhodocyclaceae bacterium]|nr:zinc ribbon domain-containing protein [Rhodocyclaceae bacterium]